MDVRKVEKKVNGFWRECDFQDLLVGDTFRMFEPTGEEVRGLNNETEFVATTNPFINEYAVWQIGC